MEQTIRCLCFTYNLLPNIFDVLIRATFFSFTPAQMFEELRCHIEKVVAVTPTVTDYDEHEWRFGNNLLFLQIRFVERTLLFGHETNLDSMMYGRTQNVISYFDVISIKNYVSRIPVNLVINDDSTFENLERFLATSQWKLEDNYRPFQDTYGNVFTFKNSVFQMWKFNNGLTHAELHFSNVMALVQCIYNVELLEQFKELLTQITS